MGMRPGWRRDDCRRASRGATERGRSVVEAMQGRIEEKLRAEKLGAWPRSFLMGGRAAMASGASSKADASLVETYVCGRPTRWKVFPGWSIARRLPPRVEIARGHALGPIAISAYAQPRASRDCQEFRVRAG